MDENGLITGFGSLGVWEQVLYLRTGITLKSEDQTLYAISREIKCEDFSTENNINLAYKGKALQTQKR